MLKWLKRIFIGCDHDYVVLDGQAYRNIGSDTIPMCHKKIFFCKKCGSKKETWG